MLSQINIQDIVAIAKEAGDAIMQIYRKNFEVECKQDNSPLTLADKKSNDIIETGLNQLSVKLPILSEEGESVPYRDRKHWKYFWLVDPLDGTKEFVKKNDEFTINIALIYKDTPVLGVVYAPALDVCYWSMKGEGAFKDGERLPAKVKDDTDFYRVVVSRSHISKNTKSFIDNIKTTKRKKIIPMGSSLKICLIAEGKADIYPRLGPTMEWDTAAAHAIMLESGGDILDSDNNQPLRYNCKKDLLNNSFIAIKK